MLSILVASYGQIRYLTEFTGKNQLHNVKYWQSSLSTSFGHFLASLTIVIGDWKFTFDVIMLTFLIQTEYSASSGHFWPYYPTWSLAESA